MIFSLDYQETLTQRDENARDAGKATNHHGFK